MGGFTNEEISHWELGLFNVTKQAYYEIIVNANDYH